jgi:predicted RND superfamily exporter protein
MLTRSPKPPHAALPAQTISSGAMAALGRGSRTRAFVRFTLRHARLLWGIALVLAIPASIATVRLYARLSSDMEELLPRDAASVRAIDELRARMPGLQYLGVVVDAGSAANLPAAERFLDDLAARVRSYPPELVRAVKLDSNDERKFIDKNAALYAELEDLVAIRDRIKARRSWELSNASGASLSDEPAPSLDFSDINRKYEERAKGVTGYARGRFSSAEPPTSLLLIEVGDFSTGADRAETLLRRVRADIAALGGTDHYAPGMQHGFSADVAISAEEISALASDLTVASVFVVCAVVLVILLYFRWWRSVPALFFPLLLATAYAFGLSTLPPFGVDKLNSNTAFLGSIIIGNGVNFAILFLARYVEARRRGQGVEDSLTEAVWGSRQGTLVAALAAGVAYGSLTITQFRGFRQFGMIGGVGMVLCWVVTFILMPPLVAWLDHGPETGPRPLGPNSHLLAPVARFIARHPRLVAGVGALLTLASLTVLPRLDSSILESDFSRLRRRDTWTEGEGFWGRKMDQLLGRYLSPTVLLTDSEAAADRLANDLREAKKQQPLASLISEIRGPHDILPADQPAKIAAIEGIRRQLTPTTRASADPAALEKFDKLIGDAPLQPIGVGDLPSSFSVGMRERDGSFGKSVLVFPTLSKANWRNENLAAYTSELRRIAAASAAAQARESGAASAPAVPRVAGGLPLSADIVASIRRDGPLASALAFAGVALLVVLMFRFRRPGFFVLGALVTGVVWLVGAIFALGVKINFVNFIAFPITFGIGVDYAVNIMSRYVQEGSHDVVGPIQSTGAAVGLCSMTTIIGYSSLLLAQNQGLFLFGLVAVLGEIACLVTALAVLPAALLLLERPDDSAPLQNADSTGSEDRHRAPRAGENVVEDDAQPAG